MISQRDHRFVYANSRERERAGMSQVDVFVIVFGEHCDKRLDRWPVPDATERLGGEEPWARHRVEQHGDELTRRRGVTQVADQLRRLGADLRIAVLQETDQRSCKRDVSACKLADPPQPVDARELVTRLTRGSEKLVRRAAIDELELGLRAHA